MLGWSKKSEGSDIRTNLELRRQKIRQRVLGAGRTAGAQVQAARAATVAGLRAAGSAMRAGARAGHVAASLGVQRTLNGLAARASVAGLGAAGGAVLAGARAGGMAAASGARRTLNGLAATAVVARQKARAATEAAAGVLVRPGVANAVGAAGALALGAGIGRYRAAGFDGEVVAMLAVGGALTVMLLPMAWPVLAGLSPLASTAAVAVAVMAAAFWVGVRDNPGPAGLSGSKEVVGRASVVAGDLLKVAGTTVRLSDIEAPERAQVCGKDDNKWRCAEAARSALWKIVSVPSVRCRLSGTDKADHPRGYCSIDGVDINAELVRQGVVFAEGGTSSRYGTAETDARAAKAGMWIGETQRPAEIRAKAWEEAKRRAPNGCPIKGKVTGDERVYVLPGMPNYKRLRVRTARGDRWFCSEQEAASAGFKAAEQG